MPIDLPGVMQTIGTARNLMSQLDPIPAIKAIPMVRGRILLPLMTAFQGSGEAPDRILRPYFLRFADLDRPDLLVPHETIYQVFRDVAEATSADFPALVGQSASLPVQLPFGGAQAASRTLADFIASFCILAAQESNAVTMSLEVNGTAALLSATRNFEPEVSPAYMDAYQVSRWITFLHDVTSQDWSAEQVMLRVSQPKLLPSYFFGVRAIGSDARGYSIRFPSNWLLCALPERSQPTSADRPQLRSSHPLPKDLLSMVNSVAASLIERADLTVPNLAAACGFREAALNRRLSACDTSLSRIVAQIKCTRAKQLLQSPDLSIGDVADQLGYSDATALTRAFRNWTGQPPSAYRAQGQANETRSTCGDDGTRDRQ